MEIYEQLGVESVINATGPVTRLGGAPMWPAVREAYVKAAGAAVSLEALHAAASQRIAELTGTQAALVTSGSAAALTLGTAAILTGSDLARMEQLPCCDGFPDAFVVAREQRSGYDHAVRAAGARLVDVGFNEVVAGAGVRRTEAWEYEAAFGANTAGVLYVHGVDAHPRLQEVVERAHRRGIPVLVDAAAELPPRANLTAIAATGADLVAFSGGKAIRGPQATGILCGRRDLIGAAAVQMLDMDDHFALWDPPNHWIDKSKLGGIPRHGIGRGLKVAKEEIVALLTALELFVSGAYEDDLDRWRAWLGRITDGLAPAGVVCTRIEDDNGERPTLLEVEIDETVVGRSALEVCRSLRKGHPPIYIGHGRLDQDILVIHPMCLDEASVDILIQRVRDELRPPNAEAP